MEEDWEADGDSEADEAALKERLRRRGGKCGGSDAWSDDEGDSEGGSASDAISVKSGRWCRSLHEKIEAAGLTPKGEGMAQGRPAHLRYVASYAEEPVDGESDAFSAFELDSRGGRGASSGDEEDEWESDEGE